MWVLIREKIVFARAHAELTLPLNDVKSRQDSSYLKRKRVISGAGSSYVWELEESKGPYGAHLTP